MNTVKVNGANFLRQRIILATLSGKSLKITKIRENAADPGITEVEMNLLRLVERNAAVNVKITLYLFLFVYFRIRVSFTNGATIKVNETGTILFYSPGMLCGGNVTHKCHKSRGVSYYLEVILALGPFCANPLMVTLSDCVTNSSFDISVDSYKNSVIPVLRQYGLYDRDSAKFEIKVNKRGAAPGGGGEVYVSMPNPKKLRPALALGRIHQ